MKAACPNGRESGQISSIDRMFRLPRGPDARTELFAPFYGHFELVMCRLAATRSRKTDEVGPRAGCGGAACPGSWTGARLAERPKKREYSRQFESRPGNAGLCFEPRKR